MKKVIWHYNSGNVMLRLLRTKSLELKHEIKEVKFIEAFLLKGKKRWNIIHRIYEKITWKTSSKNTMTKAEKFFFVMTSGVRKKESAGNSVCEKQIGKRRKIGRDKRRQKFMHQQWNLSKWIASWNSLTLTKTPFFALWNLIIF